MLEKWVEFKPKLKPQATCTGCKVGGVTITQLKVLVGKYFIGKYWEMFLDATRSE